MRHYLTQLATITKNPSAGEAGATVVATDAQASEPFPAARFQWEMATTYKEFELFVDGSAAVGIGYALETNGQLYTVREMRSWSSSRRYPNGLHSLLLSKKG